MERYPLTLALHQKCRLYNGVLGQIECDPQTPVGERLDLVDGCYHFDLLFGWLTYHLHHLCIRLLRNCRVNDTFPS